MSEGVKVLERAGVHAYDDRTLENSTCSLLKYVKEKVEAKMTKRPKTTFQRSYEKLAHEEEDKHLFTAKNIKFHVRTCRKRKKVDDQFCMDIVEGVKKWAIAKHAMDSIDDIADGDKIIVVSMKMSPKNVRLSLLQKIC